MHFFIRNIETREVFHVIPYLHRRDAEGRRNELNHFAEAEKFEVIVFFANKTIL